MTSEDFLPLHHQHPHNFLSGLLLLQILHLEITHPLLFRFWTVDLNPLGLCKLQCLPWWPHLWMYLVLQNHHPKPW
jgi:hypothetical protein